MCMLIHHPEGARPFAKAEFLDFNRRNPHGFGLIWLAPTGRVRAKKGLYTIDQQWEIYRKLLGEGVREMVLHWRFRTSGPISKELCHPFKATPDVLVMHNGVLQHRSTPTESDTMCFIADVITPLLKDDPDAYYDRRVTDWLAGKIGSGNKLVMWKQGDPEPVIIGMNRGLWHKGRWMSNTYAWTMPPMAQKAMVSRQLSGALIE